jgi:hypothetical protein
VKATTIGIDTLADLSVWLKDRQQHSIVLIMWTLMRRRQNVLERDTLLSFVSAWFYYVTSTSTHPCLHGRGGEEEEEGHVRTLWR